MLKKLIVFIFVVLLQISSASARTDTVIASVNNKAITVQELKDRIKLTTFLIQQEVSELEFNLIKDKSLADLIEEELKIQYVEELGLQVSEEELASAIVKIEKQRGLEGGALVKMLPPELLATAVRQIKDSIYDEKIITRNIVPSIFVSNSEVDRLLRNIISKSVNKEFNISRLSIKNDNDAFRTINKIYEKLKKGESFDEVSRVFSSNGQADSLGWFSLEELNLKVRKAVAKLEKGEFSEPISDNENFYIIKVNDVKITKNLDKSQTIMCKFVKFKKDEIDDSTLDKIMEFSENIEGFNDFKKFADAMKDEYGFIIENVHKAETEIQSEDKKLLDDVLPGNFSKIENDDDGLEFLYLVDKKKMYSMQVEEIRNRIRRNLENREISVRYRSFLQQLREDSFIEIR